MGRGEAKHESEEVDLQKGRTSFPFFLRVGVGYKLSHNNCDWMIIKILKELKSCLRWAQLKNLNKFPKRASG